MTEKLKIVYGDVGNVNNPLASSGSATVFYKAMSDYFDMAGSIDASFSFPQKVLNALVNFRFDKAKWRERRHKSIPTFKRHTRVAKNEFQRLSSDYDFYIQQRALFNPWPYCKKPYGIFTDATHAVTLRHWEEWSPFSDKELKDWLEYEKEIYDHAQFLFPRSKYVADSFVEDYGQDPDKIHVCGSGVNFSFIPPERQDYDMKSILFIGYDFIRKGGYNVLEAFSKARRILPEIRLTICGPESIQGELPDGVTLMGKVKDRGVISELYKNSSLYLMTSLFEPWGNVYLEAMAYSIPCIGSNFGATPEIITDGVDGLLVDPLNTSEISEAIVSILSDKSKLISMGKNGRNKVMTKFTWGNAAKCISDAVYAGVN